MPLKSTLITGLGISPFAQTNARMIETMRVLNVTLCPQLGVIFEGRGWGPTGPKLPPPLPVATQLPVTTQILTCMYMYKYVFNGKQRSGMVSRSLS